MWVIALTDPARVMLHVHKIIQLYLDNISYRSKKLVLYPMPRIAVVCDTVRYQTGKSVFTR